MTNYKEELVRYYERILRDISEDPETLEMFADLTMKVFSLENQEKTASAE